MTPKQVFRDASLFSALLVVTFLLPAIGRSAVPPLKFGLTPRYQIGLNTIQTVFADLDGDGAVDLAAVNGGEDNPNPTLTIRFGASDGTFSDPIVYPTFLIGQTITAGDLNGDGKRDLVIGGWYQNALAVIFNQGNRQFASPVFSIPPDPPYPGGAQIGEFFDLAIADFDGDGHNDVVALQDQIDQRLRFFHCSSQGVLSVFATLNQRETGTSYERKIEVGELNGDGRPDLVFAGGGPFGVRNISIVFGQPPGGMLALEYAAFTEDKAVGVSIDDLDNDGDNDLAVAFYDTTTPSLCSLRVYRNDGSGNLTLVPRSTPDYFFPPDDVTTGDFNDDGKQDLAAIVSDNLVYVTFGNGDLTYSGDTYYAMSGATALTAADVNRDGRPDILTASTFGLQTYYPDYGGVSNNTVSVLLNNGARGFKALRVALWGGQLIAAGDFNNDGYKDLASSWTTTFNSTSSVDVLINDTVGSLLPERIFESPAALSDMKTGDFNGDGKSDVVTAHSFSSRRLAVYLADASGNLSAPTSTPYVNQVSKIIVGDINLDGKDDVFAIDSTAHGFSMISNGDGSFSLAPDSTVTLPTNVPFELQKGDFNRDNKFDLIITMNSEVKLWIGDGVGRFTQSSVTLPQMSHPTPGDYNGDGKLDLVGMTAGPTGGTQRFLTAVLGDGNGGFGSTFSQEIRNFDHYDVQSLVSADFDLNGSDDAALIMADNVFGNLIVVQSVRGTPSWHPPIFYGIHTASRGLVAGDFNSDGRPDIGYLGGTSRAIIYNTTGLIEGDAPFDFDGDGKTDIGIFRPSGGEWWINRSRDGQTSALQFGSSTDVIAPADYTGDGKADIAIFRPSSGEWYVLRSDDFSYFALPFGTNGDVPVPADYDADGKADFAVFRPSSSTWFITQSSGAPTRIVPFGAAGDQPVVSDYDGDGKADIGIFRPAASGAEWWIARSAAGVLALQFGASTDKAVQGDYTGDGKADIAIWRPSTGEWFIVRSEDLSFYAFPFGATGDVVAPGDYDGDGKFDATVFRPSSATWFIARTTAGTQIVPFGANGDRPLPNAFVP